MEESPITKTMSEMLTKLRKAVELQRETQQQIAEYTNAIRALAQVCEDEDVRTGYLLSLEELSGKPGFLDAIRWVVKTHSQKKPLTPKEIRSWIILGKKMDLSGYSNAMASIHTTLRRMKDSGEIEELLNEKGEKAYRLSKANK
jgi:hypothetical protein